MIHLSSEVSNYIHLLNRRYSFFSGNNYLGLSNHPEVKQAAHFAIDKYGLNFAAARNTTGTSDIHLDLEKALSDFKNEEDTVTFASGFMGNRILLQALRDRYASLFIDELAHPSILDGIPQDFKEIHFFKHCDVQHLEDLLRKHDHQKALIITDGIFPLTGEISPVNEIYTLLDKFNALLIVDDAHATGVLGKNGKGTPEHFHLDGASHIYQTETLSKALGVYGGFISANSNLIKLIRENSKTYLASTSLPPPLVSAANASVKIVKQQPGLRPELIQKSHTIREGIIKLGFQTNREPTPIIPLFFNSRDKAMNLSGFLKENGIIVPCINYPVKIEKVIVRMTVSVNHTGDQIENLLAILEQWRSTHDVT